MFLSRSSAVSGVMVFAFVGNGAGEVSAADLIVNPGESIQVAIDSAQDGDRVLVQPGTYVESIGLLGKAIEVLGVGGAAATVLDGNLAAVVVALDSGETQASVVRGFTIRNGNIGVRVLSPSAPTIDQCVIEGNLRLSLGVEAGSGVLSTGEPTLVDCLLRDNEGRGFDGSGTLRRCTISGNMASGAAVSASTSLIECRIVENSTTTDGGGVLIKEGGFGTGPQFDRCLIAGNSANRGGGVFGSLGITARIESCWILDNSATSRGGGVDLHANGSDFFFPATVVVSRCLIADNSSGGLGGGAYLRAEQGNGNSVTVEYCTVTGNAPSGVDLGAMQKSVDHTILWSQPLPIVGAGTDVTYSNVEGGVLPGVGNISADPLFVSAGNGDHHLGSASPCIDAGLPVAVGEPDQDFEGDSIQGSRDIGADEFAPHLYVLGDLSPGGTASLNMVGTPGGGPVLLFVSLERLDSGIPTAFGPFLLGSLVPGFPITLGSIPATSLLSLPVTIPGTLPSGLSIHVQAYVGGAGAALTNATSLLID